MHNYATLLTREILIQVNLTTYKGHELQVVFERMAGDLDTKIEKIYFSQS